jgi:peroxiredoxin
MRTLLASLATLALIATPAPAGPGKYNKAIAPGDPAPSFSGLPAVLGDEEAAIGLDGIKEDVVVLVFLGNHCPFVTTVEDRLIDFVEDYKDKPVKLVGICVTPSPDAAPADYQDYAVQDTFERIKRRVKEKGYNFVYARDDSQDIGRALGAVVTPQVFVLDKERKIRYTGAIDDNVNDERKVTKTWMRDAVDALLAGKPVPEPETRATGCGVHYLRRK